MKKKLLYNYKKTLKSVKIVKIWCLKALLCWIIAKQATLHQKKNLRDFMKTHTKMYNVQ